MKHGFILLVMIFFHIVDDYYLQGILANLKQKAWWIKNAPSEMYEKDYTMALKMHSFSWAFMIMLPIAYYLNFVTTLPFSLFFIANGIIHYIVDDLKANKYKINLIVDQSIHIFQILITFYVMIVLLG